MQSTKLLIEKINCEIDELIESEKTSMTSVGQADLHHLFENLEYLEKRLESFEEPPTTALKVPKSTP